jgi:very-short-patch-repair endonuclease
LYTLEMFRQLLPAATKQLSEGQVQLTTALDTGTQQQAEQRMKEAVRQRNLLMNIGTTREESDFYPYRYLASEGFLPGYNFPRLPIRVFVPREDGEFIARARVLALTEFGPENLIYHEGAKYQVNRFVTPPGGLAARRTRAKLCNICGYFNQESDDRCDGCKTILDGSTSFFVHLLQMPNAKSIRRERITCDEEERVRRGYRTSVHFRFAAASSGGDRKVEADVGKDPNQPLFRAVFAPQANLFKVNHGWKGRNDDGFLINLATGEVNPSTDVGTENHAIVRLYVDDVENLLLLYPPSQLQEDQRVLASLQFALQRGMEHYFQVEESELASDRIGSGDKRAVVFWEAAEGGVGVLRRVVEEPNLIAKIASAALERLHFDHATRQDRKPECQQACYECLLSYSNQQDHKILNRHLVKDMLADLTLSAATKRHGGRDYESHHEYLKKLTDSRSELERKLLRIIYETRRELPDEAQKALLDSQSIPDFYYSGVHACVFCDGSVHDEPAQRAKDETARRELRERGYRVIVIRYDENIEERIAAFEDVFGPGRK